MIFTPNQLQMNKYNYIMEYVNDIDTSMYSYQNNDIYICIVKLRLNTGSSLQKHTMILQDCIHFCMMFVHFYATYISKEYYQNSMTGTPSQPLLY